MCLARFASFLVVAFLLMVDPPASRSQDIDPTADVQSLHKKLQGAQGSSDGQPGGSLKRRNVKGQTLSETNTEGLTPEQKQMYEELQQQMEQIKENRKKSDAALEELMKQ